LLFGATNSFVILSERSEPKDLHLLFGATNSFVT